MFENALWAEKSARTNVCCESNINDVLDPLDAFRDLMFLLLDKKTRFHSWEIFGEKSVLSCLTFQPVLEK